MKDRFGGKRNHAGKDREGEKIKGVSKNKAKNNPRREKSKVARIKTVNEYKTQEINLKVPAAQVIGNDRSRLEIALSRER